MKNINEKLPRSGIEKYSKQGAILIKGFPIIKARDCMWLKGVTLTGDAPKGFVRVYENQHDGKIRRSNIKTWPMYIAKTGHKWYPIESVTEHMLNRLGEVFGINMAKSRLGVINGQLRFMSRYFLDTDKESLIHGAEIFAGYLEDLVFVESVEQANLSRDFFTLQFVEKAVEKAFPKEKDQIMKDLIRLLLFDAMVGNNDRHFYNWAVIKPLDRGKKACLSPVYDTARGLFWNVSDEQLTMRINQRDVQRYIKKYCENSRPKLGWTGIHNINHFRMVKEIYEHRFYITQDEMHDFFRKEMLTNMKNVIKVEFERFFSKERLYMVNTCMDYRYKSIWEVIE